jgi:SPP1 gp7 family putative phage head morphogenesis protein
MADPTKNLDDGTVLAGLMRKLYPLAIEHAFADASLAGIPIAFDLENPFVQDVLEELALQIRDVSDTTKAEIQALVGRQAAEGWSAEELAKQIDALAQTRSRTRARTIARTETGQAYNLGAVAAYRAAGLTHVDVLDGEDDEPCKSANGSRWTLDEAAAAPLGHPNCVRAFAPVVEG